MKVNKSCFNIKSRLIFKVLTHCKSIQVGKTHCFITRNIDKLQLVDTELKFLAVECVFKFCLGPISVIGENNYMYVPKK